MKSIKSKTKEKYMKKILLIFVSLLISISILPLFTACENTELTARENTKQVVPAEKHRFGEFSYEGTYLMSDAQEQLTFNQAKKIVSENSKKTSASAHTLSTYISSSILPDQETINSIRRRYASCTITTYYYQDGTKNRLSKTDVAEGTNLQTLLSENKFSAYAYLEAHLLVVSNNVLEALEQQNADFHDSSESINCPFQDCYTYHKDSNGFLIIQNHAFSEIPSTVTGGISVSYRQDTETTYDADNKITHWQSSLGVLTSTPTGSVHEGYILEIDFKWTLKS